MVRPAYAMVGALLLLPSCGSSGSSMDGGSADRSMTGRDGPIATDGGPDRAAKDVAEEPAPPREASSDAPDDARGDSAHKDAGPDASCAVYTTTFPLTENPISESGKWINGGTTGIDWGNVRTTPGLAFGTVVSLGPPYNDSTAVLAGPWPSDQMAKATVHTVNQNSSIFEEVELRLRTTVTAHSITGYEFNFRCVADGSQYAQIVRWNGALNDFTYVDSRTGPGLHDGDVVMATAVGSTLTTYINGTAVFSSTDATFSGGTPGIGFYNQDGMTSNNADYGFSDFTATCD